MNTDELNVSIGVPVLPADAFRVFTQEIDLWWRRGPVYRTGKSNSLRLEPGVGGRFLDVTGDTGLIREIGAAQAAYSSVIVPIVAMVLSTLFEGYSWSLLAAGGAALAIIGLLYAMRSRRAKRPRIPI